MVHEVAHTLDLGDLRPGNFTRELIGEATSMGFELALSDYLLENSRFSQEGIKTYKNDLMRSIYFDSKKVFELLALCKEKETNGQITNEFLGGIPNKYNYPINALIRDLNILLEEKPSLNYRKRYAFGGLIAPTIACVIRQDGGIGHIKQYLEKSKKGDFEGALNALGITKDKEGLARLIKNMRESIIKTNEDEKAR